MPFERPRAIVTIFSFVCVGLFFLASGMMAPSNPQPVLQQPPPPSLARVRIYWDARQEPWTGLNLLNDGEVPLEIRQILLNEREDCKLRYIEAKEVETTPGSNSRLELIAYSLFAFQSIGFFLDVGTAIGAEHGRPVTMLVGDRAILIKPPQCGSLVRASIHTDRGIFKIQFDRPYTGRR